jgi:hypothetical protein
VSAHVEADAVHVVARTTALHTAAEKSTRFIGFIAS